MTKGHVKPRRDTRPRTGAKSVAVTCAICMDKVLLWHVTPGQWTGDAAAAMYKTLGAALRAHYPGRKRFTILEDNDPSGYKSKKGEAAKLAENIIPMSFPKRSPDLNPLDYNIWARINKSMRGQKKKWKPSRRETHAEYMRRLQKVASNIAAHDLKKTIGSMKRKCAACAAAHVYHGPSHPSL